MWVIGKKICIQSLHPLKKISTTTPRRHKTLFTTPLQCTIISIGTSFINISMYTYTVLCCTVENLYMSKTKSHKYMIVCLPCSCNIILSVSVLSKKKYQLMIVYIVPSTVYIGTILCNIYIYIDVYITTNNIIILKFRLLWNKTKMIAKTSVHFNFFSIFINISDCLKSAVIII